MGIAELLIESARRRLRHDEEDVTAWDRSAADAPGSPLVRDRIADLAGRLRASFHEFVEAEVCYEQTAGSGPRNAETDRQLVGHARRLAENAGRLLDTIRKLPPEGRPAAAVISDLDRLRFEADERASILQGESEMRAGDGTSWDEFRVEVGV
jgi:hypothetical protein